MVVQILDNNFTMFFLTIEASYCVLKFITRKHQEVLSQQESETCLPRADCQFSEGYYNF